MSLCPGRKQLEASVHLWSMVDFWQMCNALLQFFFFNEVLASVELK